MIIPNEDGSYTVDARALVDDVADVLHVRIEKSGSETIGGAIFEHLGGVPHVGDQVELAEIQALVTEITGHRITKMQLSVVEKTEEETEDNNRFFRPRSEES